MEKSDFLSSRRIFFQRSPSRRPRLTNTRSTIVMSSDNESEADSDSNSDNPSFCVDSSFWPKLWQWLLGSSSFDWYSAAFDAVQDRHISHMNAVPACSAPADIFISGARVSASKFDVHLLLPKIFDRLLTRDGPFLACLKVFRNIFGERCLCQSTRPRNATRVHGTRSLAMHRVAFGNCETPAVPWKIFEACVLLLQLVVKRAGHSRSGIIGAAFSLVCNSKALSELAASCNFVASTCSAFQDPYYNVSPLGVGVLGQANESPPTFLHIQPAAAPLFVLHHSTLACNKPPSSVFVLGVHALAMGAVSQ